MQPNSDPSISSPLPPHPPLLHYYDSAAERQSVVNAMFDGSANHYDRITQWMSFGTGDWYRGDALRRHGLTTGMRVLDVGAGTGSISRAAEALVGESGLVVSLDPSDGMLRDAIARGARAPVLGLGERLPIADQSIDLVVMGYALRHVSDLRATFSEYHRVLKTGGRVLLLEWTAPDSAWQKRLLKFYLRGVVPKLSGLVTRQPVAQRLMEYYWDTIERCVPPQRIIATLAEVGLNDARRDLVIGMFSEYSAVRS